MWEICSDFDWKRHSLLLNQNIFFDLDFIYDVASSYSLKVEKLICKRKGHVLGICSLYIRKNSVVTPDWFIETPIYINKNRGEETYLAIFEDLLIILKSRFTNIRMRLPIGFSDIRPCIWNGYDVKIRYTHIKNSGSAYFKNVDKKLKRLKNADSYTVIPHEFSEEGLAQILNFQKKIGIKKHILDSNALFFRSQKDNICFFSIYEKKTGLLLCSQVVLIDTIESKLYFLMISDVRSKEKGLHTYMHDFVLGWAEKEGIKQVDFCGANIKTISIFKSGFNTDLISYYSIDKENILKKFIRTIFNR